MDFIFFSKLILSFLIGGAYITFATIFADKFGSKIGGLLTGLPSIVAFGLLFIAFTQSPQVAVAATNIIPAILTIDLIFLVCYLYFAQKSLWRGLGIAMIIWSILTFSFIFFHIEAFYFFLLVYFLVLFAAYYIVEHILHTSSTTGKPIVYTPLLLLLRGCFSGFIIAFSVFLAKVGGPIWGGAFSVFPAATISAILITSFTHGHAFTLGVVKGALFSMTSCLIYILVVRYTYISLGVVSGTILAFAASYVTGLLLYQFIIKNTK